MIEATQRAIFAGGRGTVLVAAKAAVVCIALVLAACGANESSTEPDSTDDPRPPSIAGQWLSPCVPQGDGTAFELDFDLTAERWDLDYVVFADEECTQKNVTVYITGPYELTAPSTEVEGAWKGTFAFDEKTVTPHNEGMAGFLNSENGCVEGWEAGVEKDISETGCAVLGQQPISTCGQDYDLVQLDDGALMFGARPANNDMCSKAQRPAEMSGLALEKP